VSVQLLPPVVSASLPQFGTLSLLPFVIPLQRTLSVAFLRLTTSSRPSASPSGSPKCLRFGHWLTLCTINIYLLTYLLTKFCSRSLVAQQDDEVFWGGENSSGLYSSRNRNILSSRRTIKDINTQPVSASAKRQLDTRCGMQPYHHPSVARSWQARFTAEVRRLQRKPC